MLSTLLKIQLVFLICAPDENQQHLVMQYIPIFQKWEKKK